MEQVQTQKSMLAQLISRAFNEMTISKIKLDAAIGSDYNEDWTVPVTPGAIYHKFQLNTNLVERVALDRVAVELNGEEVAYAKGDYLEFIKEAFQKQETAGIFELDLSKFHYRTAAGIYQTMLITKSTDLVNLIVRFGAKGDTDPVKPSLRATAFASDNTLQIPRLVEPRKYEVTAYCSAADPEFEWSFPSGKLNKRVQQIAFGESQVNISKVVVKRGTKTINEWTRKELDHDLADMGIVPQDGTCLVDFTALGFGSKGLATNDLKFYLATDSQGSIKVRIDGYERVITQ